MFHVHEEFPDCEKLEDFEDDPELWAQCVALWLAAGCDSRKRLADGRTSVRRLVKASPFDEATCRAIAERLVDCGLWERREGEGKYVFHDWADVQETKDEVRLRRQRERDKKRAQRERAKAKHGTPPSSPAGDSPGGVPDVVPSVVPGGHPGGSPGVGDGDGTGVGSSPESDPDVAAAIRRADPPAPVETPRPSPEDAMSPPAGPQRVRPPKPEKLAAVFQAAARSAAQKKGHLTPGQMYPLAAWREEYELLASHCAALGADWPEFIGWWWRPAGWAAEHMAIVSPRTLLKGWGPNQMQWRDPEGFAKQRRRGSSDREEDPRMAGDVYRELPDEEDD